MEAGCRELLRHAKDIHDKYVTINQHTGEFFNIFQVLKVHYKEVPICRVMYELLSPEGSHGQGTSYLKLFMEEVLGINNDAMSKDEWSYIKVEREKVIDSKRRIDLVIETPNRFIPIEVKIYAGEQEQQCLDYYNYANSFTSKESPTTLFYLTRFGTMPTNYSTKGDIHLNIKTVSFADHILPWLEKCLQYNETWRLSTVSNTICQLIDVIKTFTSRKKDLEMEEIAQYLCASKENLQDALRIENAINLARRKVLKKLFSGIEEKVDEAIAGSIKKCKISKEACFVEAIEKYRNGKNLPSLSYKNDDYGEVKVRLEVDWRVYIGFTIDSDKKIPENVSKELGKKYKELLDTIHVDDSSNWRYLENKISDNSKELSIDKVPNFIEFNDAFYRLLDNEKLQAYVNYCANAFLRLLNLEEISKDEKDNKKSS
ncbi:MAG: PD-(D/E)XK nuclease family protein [Phascolarctobacterium sp.]|nr:PD-(D/E)XK nuclease family protein [Phascolarctobacterium sp.]